MQLVVNSFSADIIPVEPVLPFIDYPSWEASTGAKDSQFSEYSTWRYEIDPKEAEDPQNRYRLVFLNGPSVPNGSRQEKFDVGRFWRIGSLLTEQSLAAHFKQQGFFIEETHFEKFALRPHVSPIDDAIDLATGISFSARRPFREERYRFAFAFQWVVQAHFKKTLASESLSRIAIGMPVLYKPAGIVPPDLLPFRSRYLGRVRAIENNGLVIVICKDDQTRSIPAADLRLEASPAVIKLYEQKDRFRPGPSPILRTIQRLNRSLTADNRRSVTVLRDRMEAIRLLLQESGSSRDQLVIPLHSFDPGSVFISISPMEATLGGLW